MTAIRARQIPVNEDIYLKLKSMKGPDTYSSYIGKMMRSGSKDE